jgi:hypothetical protein
MSPLHQTRATADVLLDIGRRLRRPLELPWQTFDEMLCATFAALPRRPMRTPGATHRRRAAGGAPFPPDLAVAATATPATRPLAFAAPQFDGDAREYPFHFLPVCVERVPRRIARAPSMGCRRCRIR